MPEPVLGERPGAVPEARHYRSIVTITSANADMLGLNRADYCISKAGASMASKRSTVARIVKTLEDYGALEYSIIVAATSIRFTTCARR